MNHFLLCLFALQLMQTPSASEYNGYYNVPVEGKPVVAPCPSPPELTYAEFWDVWKDVNAALHADARNQGLSKREAETLYEYCVGDDANDRTIRVELPELDYLTVELVTSLQRVVKKQTEWRIAIINKSPETAVIIYPNVVRVGDWPASKWKESLPKLVARENELREVTEGPKRRQGAYVQSVVPKLLPELKKKSYVIAAAFEAAPDDEDDQEWAILFTLHRGEVYELDLLDPAWGGNSFEVDEEGVIRSYRDYEPGYWLFEWNVPRADFGDAVTFKRGTRKGEPDGETYPPVPLREIEFLTDEKLREMGFK